MGCQREAAIRRQYSQNNAPVVPNKTYPLLPLTEEDVRRIVKDELKKGQP